MGNNSFMSQFSKLYGLIQMLVFLSSCFLGREDQTIAFGVRYSCCCVYLNVVGKEFVVVACLVFCLVPVVCFIDLIHGGLGRGYCPLQGMQRLMAEGEVPMVLTHGCRLWFSWLILMCVPTEYRKKLHHAVWVVESLQLQLPIHFILYVIYEGQMTLYHPLIIDLPTRLGRHHSFLYFSTYFWFLLFWVLELEGPGMCVKLRRRHNSTMSVLAHILGFGLKQYG